MPFCVELDESLLELGGHVVERAGELCELVPPAHVDTLAEVARRDRERGFGEAAQRPHDRAGEQVRDEREDRERQDEADDDTLLRAACGHADRVLRREGRELDAAGLGDRRGREPTVGGVADVDARGAPGSQRERPAIVRAGDDLPVPHGDELVTRVETRTHPA